MSYTVFYFQEDRDAGKEAGKIFLIAISFDREFRIFFYQLNLSPVIANQKQNPTHMVVVIVNLGGGWIVSIDCTLVYIGEAIIKEKAVVLE